MGKLLNMSNKTLVLILCLVALSTGFCPSRCNCSLVTFDCSQCLHNFYRSYNSVTGNCDCLTGFREMLPVQDSCCPSSCLICAFYGCLTCRKNWEISINYSMSVIICVCSQNFVFNGTDCSCMAITNPTEYYYIKSADSCLKCPQGCTCNTSGCVSCESWTQRQITLDIPYNSTKCGCQRPYVSVDGLCVCTKGCNCYNGTTICSRNLTHRFQNYETGLWECIYPYQQKAGTCVCPTYFAPFSTFNDSYTKACVCLSRLKPKQYFYYAGQCQKCPFGCMCDKRGCFYCDDWTNRFVMGTGCPCKFPYVQGHGVICDCVQPFYPVDNSTCVCLSTINSTSYVLDSQTNYCYKCPVGCKCNQFGCYECTVESRRLVKQLEDGQWSCAGCIYAAQLIDDKCQCGVDGTLSVRLNDGSCGCLDFLTNFSDFLDNGKCSRCPYGCNCSKQLGCYQCDTDVNRYILMNASNYSSCPCRQGTFIKGNGRCACWGLYDTYKFDCSCNVPYTMKNGSCICMSELNPSLYYFDIISRICYICPIGCNCNQTGCYDCAPDSLRFTYANGSYSYCPCLQIAFVINGQCVTCKQGFYYMSGQCVGCSSCKACNKRGCTSCHTGMVLVDYKCVCINTYHTNVYGFCRCAPGTYQQGLEQPCKACPPYCEDCMYANQTVTCKVCPKTLTRQNDPVNNCPCTEGYKQSGVLKKYCCSNLCQSCNETGCTSCPQQTFRQLTNTQECVCQNDLIDIPGTITCGCAPGFYLYIDECFTCPINCLTCHYVNDTATIECLSCRQGMNRVNDSNCVCGADFYQTKPKNKFCVPNYCMRNQINCTQCADNMEPINNGSACVCKSGYYMNQYELCSPCSIAGCLNCSGATFCNYCDHNRGYYLVGSTCVHDMNTSDFIYAQSQLGIIVEFIPEVNLTLFNDLEVVLGYLQRVRDKLQPTSIIQQGILLTLKNATILKPNVIGVHFQNPNDTFTDYNYTLTISYILVENKTNTTSRRHLEYWIFVDPKGKSFNVYGTSEYFRRQIFYSSYDASVNDKGQYQAEYVVTVLVMVVVMVLYVKGYKHNQIPFFLQTLSFLGLTVQDKKFHMAAYLYNLRWSYYDLGNALSGIIPNWYLESSKANFSFFTIDSNIFRTCGTTILFALINCSAIIILRGFYFIFNNTPMKNNRRLYQIVNNNKKLFYRLLQFMYKTTMYPLLFFSFITYHNWHSRILIDKKGFHHFSHLLTITFLVTYFCVMLYQFYMENTSKLNKLENMSEFFFDIFGAMIVTVSMEDKSYVALLVVFIPRGIVYLVVRRMLLRDFFPIEYLKIFSVVLQVTTILLILTKSAAAVVVLSIFTVTIQFVHQISVVFLSARQASISKKKQPNSITPSVSNHVITQFPDLTEA